MSPQTDDRHPLARRPPWRQAAPRAIAFALLPWLISPAVLAQSTPAQYGSPSHWAECTARIDNTSRLACFDRWAARQALASTSTMSGSATAATPAAPTEPPQTPATDPVSARAEPAPELVTVDAGLRPCADPLTSPLSRYWELEPASDCGNFGIRVYRPISLSWTDSDSVNTAPSSPTPGHTVITPVNYDSSEARIQLSIRTKIARGLLIDSDSRRRDSLWFGYTQQSYWQLFNGNLSRPFRSTDHEPELIYIFPLDVSLDAGWRLRYAGLSLNHQSNGQSLPLSRSWNRIIVMAGMEKDDRFALRGRVWARTPVKSELDGNPQISDLVGRAELAATWNINNTHSLGLTLRHSLRSSARGSVRLEWMQAIGPARANGEPSGLRWHVQLFRGYGDSLLDYNRRRTVLSLGLSLVDF